MRVHWADVAQWDFVAKTAVMVGVELKLGFLYQLTVGLLLVLGHNVLVHN